MKQEIYCWYESFKSAEELKAKLIDRKPIKIDIGAIYNMNPKNHSAIGANFAPQLKELVIDIDMTDYDDVRICC